MRSFGITTHRVIQEHTKTGTSLASRQRCVFCRSWFTHAPLLAALLHVWEAGRFSQRLCWDSYSTACFHRWRSAPTLPSPRTEPCRTHTCQHTSNNISAWPLYHMTTHVTWLQHSIQFIKNKMHYSRWIYQCIIEVLKMKILDVKPHTLKRLIIEPNNNTVKNNSLICLQ